ncbi:MAG: hypothetical protein H6658_09060 [Ardenticatenaceae bacterium]|nr:hypothetical protein [Ardenticatenaceae bacterium]
MTQLPESKKESSDEKLKKFQEVSEIVAFMLSSLSHEVRTPTTLIKGYANLLLHQELGPLNEKQAESVNAVYQAAQRLSRIFDEITTMYHIVQFPNWQMSEPKDVNLDHLVNQLNVSVIEGKKSFGHLPPVSVDEHLTQLILGKLLLLPYVDYERKIFMEVVSGSTHVLLQILIQGDTDFYVFENDPILLWASMSFEQQGGYLEWERPNNNSLLLTIGLPIYQNDSADKG